MSIPETKVNSTMCRSVKTLQECASLPLSKPANKRLGTQHYPIITISPQKIVLDELHLMLRIGDVLIRNLVHEMVVSDKRGERLGRTHTYLDQLQATICNECKVTFRVWEKRDPDGKPSGKYDWTSMMGGDLKKVLKLLPSHFKDLLRPGIQAKTQQIWTVR